MQVETRQHDDLRRVKETSTQAASHETRKSTEDETGHSTGSGQSTRGAFLRKLAGTVAIGLGVAMVPATNAWALNARCCRNDACQISCQPNEFKWQCTECTGYSPSTCCVCSTVDGPCQDYGCGVCSAP